MANGFYLDRKHQIHHVQIAGVSAISDDAWFNEARGTYTKTFVTNKKNIFKNEIAAKKEAFLRLLKDKESK